MKMLKVPYKSGWFTVIIPTLTFLIVWFGSFLLVSSLLRGNVSDWMRMLIFGGGIILGLMVSVAIYPLLLRLADRGSGEMQLEGEVLRWRTRRQWQKIDLSQPYHAEISADSRAASLNLQQGGNRYVNTCFYRLSRDKVLDIFPEPFFVNNLVVAPQMGSWGFEDTIDSQAAGDFVAMLLKTLWKHRQQNRHFMLYEKFPWHRLPQPDFHYIRLIDWKKRCAEEETFVKKLLQQFVDGLTGSYVRVTPDYLVGWVYRSVGSTLSGQPDYYCVMPLGYINVEVSLPKPDWKPFIIGHVLKEMLTTALRTTTPGGGPYLQHRWYLHVHGRDAEGTPLELAFDWYGPGDSGYEEAQFVIRFVQR